MSDSASRTPGLHGGNYVPLTLLEFQYAYALFGAVLNGDKLGRSDFPTVYQDAITGDVVPLPNTPFNRAWHAAGMTFEDEAKRISFGKRVEMMTEFIKGKYSKYFDRTAGTMHVALMATIARVPFSVRTTKKALRAAFDDEFKRQLAKAVEVGQPAPGQQLECALPPLASRQALDLLPELDVLDDGAPGQQEVLLQHEGDVPVGPCNQLAVDMDLARRRRIEARAHVQEGALATA